MEVTWIPLIGSITAAIIGGAISLGLYTLKQYSDKKSEIRKNKAILLNQLMYTYEILFNPHVDIDFSRLLYDDKWYERIINCDFTESEERLIMKWFTKIKAISNGFGMIGKVYSDIPIKVEMAINTPIQPAMEVENYFRAEYQAIKDIIDKYKNA